MDHDQSLNRTAFQATLHCLTGCAIGEVLGLVIAAALGWHDIPSIALAVVLAFVFGYALTVGPLLRGGLGVVAFPEPLADCARPRPRGSPRSSPLGPDWEPRSRSTSRTHRSVWP